MADSTTTNYGWAYPTVNADADTWGTTLNNAIIAIDSTVKSVATGAQAHNAKLDGLSGLAGTAGKIPYFSATATFAELAPGTGLSISGNALNAAVQSVAGKAGAVTLTMADITDQRIGTAKIFVQVGGSPPAMNNGDICVIL